MVLTDIGIVQPDYFKKTIQDSQAGGRPPKFKKSIFKYEILEFIEIFGIVFRHFRFVLTVTIRPGYFEPP